MQEGRRHYGMGRAEPFLTGMYSSMMGSEAKPSLICLQEVKLDNAGAWADLAEDDGEGDKPKQNGEDQAGNDEDDDAGDEEKGDDLWEQFQSREEQQLQQVLR